MMHGKDSVNNWVTYSNRMNIEDIIGYLSVKDYGALGDGSHDDTQAFKDAIAAGDSRAKLYIPSGYYKITETIDIPHNYFHVQGAGIGATRILFAPTANVDTVCFRFKIYGEALYFDGISDLTITGYDDTSIKTAIEVWDGRSFYFQNIAIQTFYATGGKAKGLNILGRDNMAFNNIYIDSDRPIFLGTNGWAAGTDMYSFTDCYLIARIDVSTHPVIEVDDNMSITNISFNGRQSWSGGSVGFYLKYTGAGTGDIARNLIFNNVRTEQQLVGSTPKGRFSIYINMANDKNAKGIIVNNCYLQRGGVFLRGARDVTLSNIRQSGTGNDTAIYADATVSAVCLNNVSIEQAPYLTGAVAVSGTYHRWGAGTYIYEDYYYIPRTENMLLSPTVNATTNYSQLSSPDIIITASGTANIGSHEMIGILFITDVTGGNSAIYSLNGATTTEMVDIGAYFSVTKDAGTQDNIYYDGGTSRYILQNKYAVSHTYRLLFVGKHEFVVD
jgi:hypothetical protein